ncbi:hypothetical protein KFK09_001045 [Dendrobium nobile]|uniref:Uncharacterized protein n=1 Tax=Dendrobium nobile TaxID=94219 RepID=A0A8T3CFM1_DENNO|nr:hypothetical protein KFK09_020140 [Dendrobium nobile]KAI0531489.1 hypothetical protein KFK09_001045 [Dendrobium nobile]
MSRKAQSKEIRYQFFDQPRYASNILKIQQGRKRERTRKIVGASSPKLSIDQTI